MLVEEKARGFLPSDAAVPKGNSEAMADHRRNGLRGSSVSVRTLRGGRTVASYRFAAVMGRSTLIDEPCSSAERKNPAGHAVLAGLKLIAPASLPRM